MMNANLFSRQGAINRETEKNRQTRFSSQVLHGNGGVGVNFWVLTEPDIEKNPVKIHSAAEEWRYINGVTLVNLIRVG